MAGIEKIAAEINKEIELLKDAKKKKFYKAQTDAILNHIKEVADDEYYDNLNQDHKSFKRMWKFVTNHAKDYAINNCAMIEDATVYGWVDEYVGLDDKAEVEKELKKSKEIEKKTSKSKDKPFDDDKKEKKFVANPVELPMHLIKKEEPKQVSIFDLM